MNQMDAQQSIPVQHVQPDGCDYCMQAEQLEFDFSMAFQPIVDVKAKTIFGYEALVRGVQGEPAYVVIDKVQNNNSYAFDQMCRVKAITLAKKLGMTQKLSINFMPNAVYKPERCIKTTLRAAREVGFAIDQIMFEFTETEKITDVAHVEKIIQYYSDQGFITAIDDFGAGYAGLGLLSEFQPHIVKLDMALLRGIDTDKTRQAIVKHQVAMLRELGCEVLAEGIETHAEYAWLKAQGITLMQGYFFAKPAFEALPEVDFSQL